MGERRLPLGGTEASVGKRRKIRCGAVLKENEKFVKNLRRRHPKVGAVFCFVGVHGDVAVDVDADRMAAEMGISASLRLFLCGG